jgi:hypothetical protein
MRGQSSIRTISYRGPMKHTFLLLVGSLVLATVSGCVVAPGRSGYEPASAAVYIGPTYESPGPGWAWQQHPTAGWGWHHSEHGWHKGWR